MGRPSDPTKWWGSVTNLCNQGVQGDESDGVDTEEDLQSLGSDGEEVGPRKSKIHYNPRSNFKDFKFLLGMEFGTAKLLRTAIKEYFIESNREFKYVSNDMRRIRVKCKAKQCPWLLYASVSRADNTTFKVQTLVDNHNCGLVLNNSHADAPWLSKYFLEQFRINPDMKYKTFRDMTTKTKYSHVSNWVFYRAKARAKILLEGSVSEQYAILEDYCKMILATNPGSTAIIKSNMVEGKRIFERVYICLKACKEGFRSGCRPLIGLDGCFLKGYCKGFLLAAVGIDATNSMYPIAYVVCEKENTNTWSWFLELLKEDLDIDRPSQFAMMSDRQKGLENAIASVFEGAEVRNCVRHLHSNFKKDHPGLLLKQQLWAAAKATTIPEFQKRMRELRETSENAYNWLSLKTPSEWSRSHFSEMVKCDMLLNNLCESFNAAIVDARDKPIITLLEKIRYWLMSRFFNKRESLKKWIHPVGKRILQVVEKNKSIAKNCLTTRAATYQFQVDCPNNESFDVDLQKRTCSCRRFQLTGIPCGHALAAIWTSGAEIMDYIQERGIWIRKRHF
ncbi:uncharacterized protein LOC133795917 [Humulus lupulus]|uniref:uncharacterized protein LOC133795917 n=1 Tax=Humulus lupulus TaxID=3486 RepID=UPI002B4121F4|nr:uncharacterized protein LOC133795917 [Humulus lupulus]